MSINHQKYNKNTYAENKSHKEIKGFNSNSKDFSADSLQTNSF